MTMPVFTPKFIPKENENGEPYNEFDSHSAFLAAAEHVLKIPISQFWNNTQEAIATIMRAAEFGNTPLSLLVIIGHHGISRPGFIGSFESLFDSNQILQFADRHGLGNNQLNDYQHAKNRQGPPRCWMRHGAKIYALGCWTSDSVLMDNIVHNLARSSGKTGFGGVVVYGLNDEAIGVPEEFTLDGNRNPSIIKKAYLKPKSAANIQSRSWDAVTRWSDVWQQKNGWA